MGKEEVPEGGDRCRRARGHQGEEAECWGPGDGAPPAYLPPRPLDPIFAAITTVISHQHSGCLPSAELLPSLMETFLNSLVCRERSDAT